MRIIKTIINRYTQTGLILRILIGIAAGIALGLLVPGAAWISTIGKLFVGALKAIAPVLVAVLVIASLCQKNAKLDRRFGLVIFFYLLSTLLASVAAVIASFVFPQTIALAETGSEVTQSSVPKGIGLVQDSMETALNSSGDVLFTATSEYVEWKMQGKPLPDFLEKRRNK